MKKHFDAILVIAVAIFLVIMVVITIGSYAKADEPQIVTINVIPAPTPKPVYRPVDDNIPKYDIPEKDIKLIAKLLWSSPLRSMSEKTDLIWLVLNRIDHGEPFGTTCDTVITKSEFSFYDRHARVSDVNRELVKETMNLWYAEKDGHGIGKRPPKTALYCRFTGELNRKIELLDENKKVIDW